MRNLLLFFYFDLLRLMNDGLPSIAEVTHALNTLAGERMSQTIYDAATDYYVTGGKLDSIARTRHTTRERQRQLILKACKMARDVV